MSYFPHVLHSASGHVRGIVESVRISAHTGRGNNENRLIFLDVVLVGVPGDKCLRNVRYYGRLYLPVGAGVTLTANNPAFATYDALLTEIVGMAPYNGSWEDLGVAVDYALKGRLVMPLNLGGRWIIQ